MARFVFLLLCVPIVALAQAPTPAPKPVAPATRTAAPAPRTTPAPATRKPAPPSARRPVADAAPTAPAALAPLTGEERVIYAIGLVMQRSLRQFDLSPSELDIVKRALTEAAAGKPAVNIDEVGPQIEPLAQMRRERVTARDRAASLEYLTTAAAQPGAVKTTSGLVYSEITPGTGGSPTASDFVRVHYRGTLVNGTTFEDSYARNEPAELSLKSVIPCWTEGVQRMRVGGKSQLVCPSQLAYGENANADIPAGSTLIFEIEVLGIVPLR